MTDQPTHGLSVQHADALWDAVAIPGPTEPTFPMQHERVCRAVAGILDELRTPPAVPVSSPPPDQTPLRDRGAKAEALLLRFTAEAHRRKWNYDRGLDVDGQPIKSEAFDALHRLGDEMNAELHKLRATPTAAPPPPADRAAVLQWAADFAEQLMDERYGPDCSYGIGGLDVARELRRLAAEAQQPDTETQAHPPIHAWRVETRDPLADQWAPGSHFAHRPNAVERLDAANRTAPLWNDGTPVERRIVRETTTYTVEEPPPAHIGGNADDCPACQTDGLDTIGPPYECPGDETADEGSEETQS